MAKFDVLSAPVTEDTILKGRKVEAISSGVAYAGVVFVFLSVLLAALTQNPLFAISCLLGILGILGWAMTSSNEYSELPAVECGEMLALCEQTEEGRQYRQAVLAQGRKFVVEELTMMKAWVEGISNRENCKKLYGMAPAGDTLSKDAQ